MPSGSGAEDTVARPFMGAAGGGIQEEGRGLSTAAYPLLVPVLLLLMVAVAAIAGVLGYAAVWQDREMAAQTVRMVQVSVTQAETRLGDIVIDYASWNESADQLAGPAPDAEWVDRTLGSYLTNHFGITDVVVVGDDGRIRLALQDGTRLEATLGAPPPGIMELVRRARTSPPGVPKAATGIVVQGGRPHLAAAADIRYEGTGARPAQGAVLVFLRLLADPILADLAAPLPIQKLRLHGAAPAGDPATTLALADPEGQPAGWLSWQAPAPGSSLLHSVQWFLVAIIVAMVGLTALFLARAQRVGQQQARALAELAQSEERYRALVDAVPDLISLVRDGEMSLINAGGLDMLGLDSPVDADGVPLLDFIAETARGEVRQRLAEAGAGRPCNWEPIEFRRRDGSAVPTLTTLLPIEDEDGRAVLVVSRDVSDRAVADEVLRQARAEAELADRAKGQFLSNISHELRTPLNAIIGFSEILRDELLGSLGNPQYRDYAVDIHEGGLHLLRLVNDLLDIARLDAGRLELREAWLDVDALVDRCVRLVAQKANEAGIAIEVDAGSGGGQRLLADEVRLKQVLVNLLSNAIRFSERGDRVTVAAGTDVEGDFCLCVSDTGVGMTPEALRLALQPFGQVETGHNRRQPGAGLGLPLAKGYVEAHGGRLGIQSTPGVGTMVTVTLPKNRLYRSEPARSA
ncbi:MAG TPA: ATP-binding protein [Azospirillaceae bacterium]|nr:ATP-binding protein [Azospirillaceae bacterium]